MAVIGREGNAPSCFHSPIRSQSPHPVHRWSELMQLVTREKPAQTKKNSKSQTSGVLRSDKWPMADVYLLCFFFFFFNHKLTYFEHIRLNVRDKENVAIKLLSFWLFNGSFHCAGADKWLTSVKQMPLHAFFLSILHSVHQNHSSSHQGHQILVLLSTYTDVIYVTSVEKFDA